MAHQDVVSIAPGTEKNWVHEPFSGDIAEGYVRGCGAARAVRKAQPRWFKSRNIERESVIDEGSFITDEMIGGINKPVAVLQTE